jgi:hypothetical protein
MSSGSYSGLAIHELVHQYWKEFIAAPKAASSGKAEQYVMPFDIEQLRGLPKSFVVVGTGIPLLVEAWGEWLSGWPISGYAPVG